MKLRDAFPEVVQIANQAQDPGLGLRTLASRIDPRSRFLGAVASLDIAADIVSVRSQLQALIRDEPPPNTIKAIWFGLFDSSDEDDEESIGYYASGVERYDPDDSDSLCDPKWWPEGRYLESVVLHEVKRAEVAALEAEADVVAELIAYAGQLGAAMLVSRFASAGLFPGCPRIVGFDSGDTAELAE